MLVSKISNYSGQRHEMELPVTSDQLLRYEEGYECVQNIFPNLSPEEREFIITGMTKEEWDEMCSTEEEETLS